MNNISLVDVLEIGLVAGVSFRVGQAIAEWVFNLFGGDEE